MWHQHAGRCSCKHKQSVREDQSSAGMYILLVYLPDVIEDGVAAGDGLKVARDLLAVRPDIMHPVVCDCVEGGETKVRRSARRGRGTHTSTHQTGVRDHSCILLHVVM